jgi:hypothetical protein
LHVRDDLVDDPLSDLVVSEFRAGRVWPGRALPPQRYQLLDRLPGRVEQVALAECHSEPGENGGLGGTPDRFGVDEQAVHVEDDGLRGRPCQHGQVNWPQQGPNGPGGPFP